MAKQRSVFPKKTDYFSCHGNLARNAWYIINGIDICSLYFVRGDFKDSLFVNLSFSLDVYSWLQSSHFLLDIHPPQPCLLKTSRPLKFVFSLKGQYLSSLSSRFYVGWLQELLKIQSVHQILINKSWNILNCLRMLITNFGKRTW